jgi:rRNA processing protein Gar1
MIDITTLDDFSQEIISGKVKTVFDPITKKYIRVKKVDMSSSIPKIIGNVLSDNTPIKLGLFQVSKG